ncbi:hypothetical protein [Micromonospora purpureochromogenes]|uniref:Uncharacterized protein n=1 Tax=Micromonospora purpureochromogenes TaxID=47872 RepID=A0ABX2RHB0_9ACTN|nr:hypothetical protein [Micromonospora purpureochromogenes]NYF55894.1 hypothetical protein [Micromonospora purpureochromogenes]
MAVFLGAVVRLSPEAVVRLRVRAAARLCSGTVVWLSFSAAIKLSPGVPVREVVSLRGVAFLGLFRLVGDAGVSGCATSGAAAGTGGVAELTEGVGVPPELTGPVGSAAPGVTGATAPTGRPGCSTGVPSPPRRWSVGAVPVVAALVAAVPLSAPLVDSGAAGVLPVVACLVDRAVCCPSGACRAVEVLRFRGRSAAVVSAVTCPVISCSPAVPPAAVPPLGLAPASSRPVGTPAGPVPPGSVGVPALPDALLAGRGWRGSG